MLTHLVSLPRSYTSTPVPDLPSSHALSLHHLDAYSASCSAPASDTPANGTAGDGTHLLAQQVTVHQLTAQRLPFNVPHQVTPPLPASRRSTSQ